MRSPVSRGFPGRDDFQDVGTRYNRIFQVFGQQSGFHGELFCRMYRVFFVTHFVSLVRSLCETYEAEIFSDYLEHIKILCWVLKKPYLTVKITIMRKKLKKST